MGLADFTNSIITKDGFSNTFRKFDGAVQGSARGLDKLGRVMSGGGLGMLFGGMAGAAGAIAIGKMAWNMGELGKVAITTERSFNNLMQSVGISTSIIDQYAAAADGTIAKTDLMRMANVALAGTTGELSSEMARLLPTLIEGARAASALNPAMGDASFMLQSLITGVKRGSPMLIDNTGIVLKLGEANEAMAQKLGKSVEALTAQEKSLAILYATADAVPTLVGQVGDAMDETATSSMRLKVSWQELREELGKALAPTVTGIQEGAASALNQITSVISSDELDRQSSALRSWTEQLAYLNSIPVNRRDAMWADDVASATAQIKRLNGAVGAKIQAEQAANMVTQAAAWSARDAASAYSDSAVASQTAGINASALAATLQGVRNAYSVATGAASQYAAALGGTITSRAFIGGADVLSQSQYTNLTQSRINLERGLQVQVLAGIKTQMEADYALAQYDNTVNNHISSLRTQSTAVASTATAYDDLKSKISSALRPTFDLSGLTGGLLGGMGGDAFDEAYKRLAAVALRPEELQIHAQDWGDTFAQAGLTGMSPEDAQAEATRLVEAYSKGLDFSLIDREAIKDSVRQSIRAEELYNTIVDEIYAEMGKEKPKLAQAGTNIGNQLNRAATATVQSGAAAYVGAWLDVLEPGMIARLDARYRRTGQAQ
jgi:hypothetical protein